MKTFEDVNPETVLTDPRIMAIFTIHDEFSIDGTHYFALVDGTYVLLGITSLPKSDLVNPTGLEWCGGIILEVPAIGFKWFIDTLENKFFKTEAEGGLHRGIFTAETEIEGEELSVARMFGFPGYSFRNHSRISHWAERNNLSGVQELELSDELLFERGYFDELKKLKNLL